jgi:cytochrome b subunit of formate dehydrogenase
MRSKKNNKATVNYVVDLIIMVGFILAAVSGLVLLFAGSGGYQGGRNPRAVQEVLSLSRWTWKALHDWGGIAVVGGVLVHFVLHWKWIVCMTRNLLHRGKPSAAPADAPQCRTLEG